MNVCESRRKSRLSIQQDIEDSLNYNLFFICVCMVSLPVFIASNIEGSQKTKIRISNITALVSSKSKAVQHLCTFKLHM